MQPRLGLCSHPFLGVEVRFESINVLYCAVRPFGLDGPMWAFT